MMDPATARMALKVQLEDVDAILASFPPPTKDATAASEVAAFRSLRDELIRKWHEINGQCLAHNILRELPESVSLSSTQLFCESRAMAAPRERNLTNLTPAHLSSWRVLLSTTKAPALLVLTHFRGTICCSSGVRMKFVARREQLGTPNRTYRGNNKCSRWIHPAKIVASVVTCLNYHQQTCATCKAKKHNGLCPEDKAVKDLLNVAKQKRWQTCQNCKEMVELERG